MNCPRCGDDLRYVDDGWYICDGCGDEWDQDTIEAEAALSRDEIEARQRNRKQQ